VLALLPLLASAGPGPILAAVIGVNLGPNLPPDSPISYTVIPDRHEYHHRVHQQDVRGQAIDRRHVVPYAASGWSLAEFGNPGATRTTP
jgi:hypothetical protein